MAEKTGDIGESWDKNLDKKILSILHEKASEQLGYASMEPTMGNVKMAFGSVSAYKNFLMGFVGYIPENRKIMNELKERLNEIELVLNGNPELPQIKALCKKFNVGYDWEREGVRAVMRIRNLSFLTQEMGEILAELTNYAYVVGLRFRKPEAVKGWQKVLETERISDEEIKKILGDDDADEDTPEGDGEGDDSDD